MIKESHSNGARLFFFRLMEAGKPQRPPVDLAETQAFGFPYRAQNHDGGQRRNHRENRDAEAVRPDHGDTDRSTYRDRLPHSG
ncbi:hypothetical protein [Paraburkholderia sp. CI3]|uniref:hypothetical protein n=1 Tax=Paraburkholderia sp. CI3 TaxID=2991060 RepID=UPI003D20C4E0